MTRTRYPRNTQTARAITLFRISGQRVPPQLVAAYLQIKAACARANWDCGVLSTGHRNTVLRSISEIRSDSQGWRALFPVDRFQAGAGTTLNMNVNEAIAQVARRRFGATLHPNDVVNRSQSTNDTYPTALRLALLGLLPELREAIAALGRSFGAKSREFAKIPKVGRTHLQDAVPMRLGQQFGSYARTIEKLEARLESARRGLIEIPLGGTAVGTGATTPRGFRAAALRHLKGESGLDGLRTPRDPFEIQASALDFVHYAQALEAIALELTRIGADLRLQASGPRTGIHELVLPTLLPGSSIMPGKSNPSGLEMLQQVLIEVLGLHQMTGWAAALGQLELNVMLPAIGPTLIESTQHLTRALLFTAEQVIVPLAPSREELERNWKSTEQWATLLSPEWGYDQVAEWVRAARASGEPFVDWVEKNRGIRVSDVAAKRARPTIGRSRGRRTVRKPLKKRAKIGTSPARARRPTR